MENGPRAYQGRDKHGKSAVETPDIAMVADDRRVTAFVLSMLKANAQVRQFDMGRRENSVGREGHKS